MKRTGWTCLSTLAVLLVFGVIPLRAATISVPAGGDLQAALDAATPGDTILLAEGAEYVGNFVLPVKTGTGWITLRTSTPDALLPLPGVRIQPANAPLLARIRSATQYVPALQTAPGAHHWIISYLEFSANPGGYGEIIQLGDGSSAQNTLTSVPHHLTLDHLYIHGDPVLGQKRGIALNASNVTIKDSYISDCKGIGQDTQAIGGWNGPGPYTIENNYLEASGENVMFGGADPAIPNLVADGITFRANYVSRPMSWRNPLVTAPQGVTATPEAGGSLAAGTYAYRVIARRAVGQGTTARSVPSTEVSVTTTAASAVRVRWQTVAGAYEYRVYGRMAGAENIFWTVTGTEFVDTGAAGTSENLPTTATVWTVKNLFELKNARNVVVEDNIFENHWKEAQPGYAIVLTPRNSNGACTWCVVEHVRFEHNIIRNVAAGINLTGYDAASRPTRQSNDIVVLNNLFTGLNTSLGGNAWFMVIGDGPRDISIEHNTIDHNGSNIINVYGGTSADPKEVYGFRYVGNASRHGSYGINGSYFTYGINILNGFFPGWVFYGNYLAGGSASRYPSGNLFQTPFEAQFAGVPNDYTVRNDSPLKGFLPDGTDVGVDFAELTRRTENVVSGITIPRPQDLGPTANFTETCSYLDCAFTDTSTAGSSAINAWAWNFGDGTHGSTAQVSHHFAAPGTYTVALTVTDANGLTSSTTRAINVSAPNVAPTAAFSTSCVDLVCTFTDRSTDTDGTVVSWNWSNGVGGTATTRSASFTFAAPGTYTVTLTVADDDGAISSVSTPVQVVALVHAALVNGVTRRWYSPTNPSIYYWSADITLAVHGANERVIAGATVNVAWSGAVTKTASCVTTATGQCVFKSGTLSMLRTWVTLTVTSVSAPGSTYTVSANHGLVGNAAGTAITYLQP
jgi:PKD repeat protein